ncbi:hypothetical protein E8E13_005175 [Curvularia kusanoi]|uniref:Uncharacterized protein n=1 Tax=Curvularia kusanoi TaxID=90978 RepID=A0A9P4W9K3_CURKU|nr:hypothetical protein E8E13_005175 [Curvularia kusanoi]
MMVDDLSPSDCTSIPEDAKESSQDLHPYASFGDNGTTATISAYGRLMQICQTHASSRSGVISAEPRGLSKPSSSQWRVEDLMNMRTSEHGGLGLLIAGLPDRSSETKLEFLHNRWPLSTTAFGDTVLKILHVAFRGVIFQQYHLSTTGEPVTYRNGLNVSMADTMLIRDLDSVDSKYTFNNDDRNNKTYSSSLCEDGTAYVLKHFGLRTHDGTKNFVPVALAVSIFVNGVPQMLAMNEQSEWRNIPCIEPPGRVLEVEENRPLQITVAYRVLPNEGFLNSTTSPIRPMHLHAMHKMLETTSFTTLNLSNDSHMNFVMLRNLEHILSVCSIPSPRTCNDGTQCQGWMEEQLALTCGDMAGHRIVTSASFFAFQFLLSMYKHLDTDKLAHKQHYATVLKKRIQRVCKGHVVWLRAIGSVDNRFQANYWVTGERFDDQSSPDAHSLTDTPFQLIKLAEFGRIFHSNQDDALFRDLAIAWIRQLDAANLRGFYAFPRTKTDMETLQTFRLDDHVWIWRALQSIEDVVQSEKSKKRENPSSQEQGFRDWEKEELELVQKFSPAVFQDHALRRFTTENPVSKQRMFAVSRSRAENRFYLHSRDTALFYKENMAFFSRHNALWEATMDSQQYHEPDNSSQREPLRCALAIVTGKTMCCLRGEQSDILAENSKAELLKSASAAGVFPGAQNRFTMEPETFRYESRGDAYWHTIFEIPYVLWQHADDSHAKAMKSLSGKIQAEESYTKTLAMDKWEPFDNVTTPKGVVEYTDEWLYELPHLFRPEKAALPDLETAAKDMKGFVLDVVKGHRKESSMDIASDNGVAKNDQMYERLRSERTICNSKKRLIWISDPSPRAQEICYATSTIFESEPLNQFFTNHGKNSNCFSEEITATENLWITGLHLSSYRKLDDKEDRTGGIQLFPSADAHEHLSVKRESVGFRFVGDFFDRCWTCHVLKAGESLSPKEVLESSYVDKSYQKSWKQRKVLELLLLNQMLHEIRERYNEIMEKTKNRLQEMIFHARGLKPGETENDADFARNMSFMRLDNDTYLRISKSWPAISYTLWLIEDDLTNILKKIDLWNRREKDRDPYFPRWTMKDERKYRTSIDKYTSLIKRTVQLLREDLASSESLRKTISAGLTSAREEQSFKSGMHITSFTYLTGVFLPLGFATGLWSMGNESPHYESVKGMIITSFITLVPTIAVLLMMAPCYDKYRQFAKRLREKSSCSKKPSVDGNPTPQQRMKLSPSQASLESPPGSSETVKAGCLSRLLSRRTKPVQSNV